VPCKAISLWRRDPPDTSLATNPNVEIIALSPSVFLGGQRNRPFLTPPELMRLATSALDKEGES
jgi:hypothetical protein